MKARSRLDLLPAATKPSRKLALAFAAALAVTCAPAAARAQAPGPETVVVDSAHPVTGMVMPRREPARVYTGLSWRRQNLDAPVVTRVADDSPGSRAGLQPGDVLLAVDGAATAGHPGYFPHPEPGRRYTLRVRREDRELELEIVLDPPRPGAP